MNIDILVGENLYESTAYFAKSLKRALEKAGINVRLFWIAEDFFFQAFYEIASNPPDLTCSFSDIRMGKRPLADLWNVPHLSFFIDPAIYFLHHVQSPYSIIASVDEEDVSFIRSFGFSNAFFFPHAADVQDMTSVSKKRPFEKVFFGSCIDIEKVSSSWKTKYSKAVQEILYEAIQLVLSPKEISCLKALAMLEIKEHDLPLLHYEVDLYTRGKDRIELLKNQDVHIWGTGPWEKYCPKAKIQESIPFEKCIEIMKLSKLVFNSSPRFKKGSHERILNAFMCGACPVTLENGFTQKYFTHDELITYQTGIWDLSPSTESWQDYAEKGQKRVIEEHTWDVRVEMLLEYLANLS